jgi:hypothetical protein
MTFYVSLHAPAHPGSRGAHTYVQNVVFCPGFGGANYWLPTPHLLLTMQIHLMCQTFPDSEAT